MNGQPKRQQTRLGDTKPIRHIHELPSEVYPHISQYLTTADIVSLRETSNFGVGMPKGSLMNNVAYGATDLEIDAINHSYDPNYDGAPQIYKGPIRMSGDRYLFKRQKKPLNKQYPEIQRLMSRLGYMP